MHIHGAQMNLNAASLSAAAVEKAAEMRRAAEVRKKLLKASGEIGGTLESDENFLIVQWHGSSGGETQDEDEYRPSTDPYCP
jgi:hypothetical protein